MNGRSHRRSSTTPWSAASSCATRKTSATAELFYTAYFRSDAPKDQHRPVIFSYNGGPGSASFWLHMGIMGPKRVVTPIVGQQAPPPYELEENDYTVLDIADIVMIDPVGTGLSRSGGRGRGQRLLGIGRGRRFSHPVHTTFPQPVRALELTALPARGELRHDPFGSARGAPAARQYRPERHHPGVVGARFQHHQLQRRLDRAVRHQRAVLRHHLGLSRRPSRR